MKLFYSLFISFLISISSLSGQGQDLLFIKGKKLPLKGNIISKGDQNLGETGKVFFIEENSRKPKYYKLAKIDAILRKEHRLYIEPNNSQAYRDFSELPYGVIFLSNGQSIAITSWEVIGPEGDIEFIDYFSGEAARLEPDRYIAIYTKEPNLNLFGDISMTLSRLKTAMLPEPRDIEIEPKHIAELPVTRDLDEPIEKDPEPDPVRIEEVPLDTEPLAGPSMPVDMDEFNEKAKQKVEKFASYVKTILEGEDRLRIRSVIDQALILFVSDTCFIEVSSLGRPRPTSYNIRRYFNRLNYLADKYTKIEVTDGKVVKVSDIRKYKDNWYGTVTYGQRFSGYKDGMLVYTDYTQKNINIVLKVYEPEIEGESTAIWDVLLSNISVTETSQ